VFSTSIFVSSEERPLLEDNASMAIVKFSSPSCIGMVRLYPELLRLCPISFLGRGVCGTMSREKLAFFSTVDQPLGHSQLKDL
jgi:hypothetical protein